MLIGLDSDVLIASLSPHEAHSEIAQTIITQIAQGKHKGVVSSLTYGEVLSLNTGRSAKPLDLEVFFAKFNLKTIAADNRLCQAAGGLRREYGMKLPDAIHLATALDQKVDVFVTNDSSLLKIAKRLLPTKTLGEWTK
jgi:predicted nucleic acid-binding protein